MKLSVFKVVVCLLACFALTACETINDKRKVDYKNPHELPPLEVPPDLTALPDANRPAATAAGATYSEFATERGPAAAPSNPGTTVLPRVPDLRIERDGRVRWLVAQESPEQLWPRMRKFVVNAGLVVERENPIAGVIETGWIEDRPEAGKETPLALTRWLDSLASAGSRNRFRIRLDRGSSPGTTEIYVAHTGLEKAVSGAGAAGESEGAKWRWRPSEPDLEVELMRHMMVYLGKSEEQASAIAAKAPPPPSERARLGRQGESVVLLSLDDSPERAWRRVGLSLDRVGFTVEDRDRSKGIYYVRYLDPDADADRPGWFARLFGAEDKTPDDRYQIQLQDADAGTNVVVRNENGDADLGKTSERILSLLYEQLK